MDDYNKQCKKELMIWKKKMSKKPSIINTFTTGTQKKFNNLVPENIHKIVTAAIKNMVKAVLVGSEFTSTPELKNMTFKKREDLVREKLDFYKKTATVSGAGTGVGGIVLGMADFPILLSLKMKFLFDAASFYGFDVRDYRERLFILHIFQLAFSSQKKRSEVYKKVLEWDKYAKSLPLDINVFDWRSFQQEYRDYMDIAKMLQMVPVIGAAFGAYANYRLVEKLGETAMNAYRMRIDL
ncbi:EcsC family protein [Clostridium sediminicola]|uniref:EcsC family protein n=1 Tax=Clostridium sediminicola TaxID=3114879 RepID=UPI0031F233BB